MDPIPFIVPFDVEGSRVFLGLCVRETVRGSWSVGEFQATLKREPPPRDWINAQEGPILGELIVFSIWFENLGFSVYCSGFR
jgi:hypothetical protein